MALTARGQGGMRLTAVDARAAAQGLAPGMSLADARALVPELVADDAEPAAEAASLAVLADWCTRYSPWSAPDGADGIRLDITGCAHLFGGEAALLQDALSRCGRFGLDVRGAVADTPAASWAWSRHCPPGADPILPVGAADRLLPLPVAALRLPDETVAALERLGLRTIGAVADMPRAPLGRRLGAEVLRRLDRLFGRLAEPISPRPVVEPWVARLTFVEPIGRREDLDTATLPLLERLCVDLREKGRGARRLELAFYRVDGTVQRLQVGTSLASHAPPHLMRLFAEKLGTVAPGFGIEAMALTALETDPIAVRQVSLDAADATEIERAALVDRLQNRLGRDRVVQFVPLESHVPERAERRVPALSAPIRPVSTHPDSVRARFAGRPLKLLPRPEQVEAMAPIPDDPPLTFRWRRGTHRIVAADGPERIGPEWWRPGAGRTRDYYRVEDSEGRRFWLYRDGLYGGKAPPRWFLHGFFA